MLTCSDVRKDITAVGSDQNKEWTFEFDKVILDASYGPIQDFVMGSDDLVCGDESEFGGGWSWWSRNIRFTGFKIFI